MRFLLLPALGPTCLWKGLSSKDEWHTRKNENGQKHSVSKEYGLLFSDSSWEEMIEKYAERRNSCCLLDLSNSNKMSTLSYGCKTFHLFGLIAYLIQSRAVCVISSCHLYNFRWNKTWILASILTKYCNINM